MLASWSDGTFGIKVVFHMHGSLIVSHDGGRSQNRYKLSTIRYILDNGMCVVLWQKITVSSSNTEISIQSSSSRPNPPTGS